MVQQALGNAALLALRMNMMKQSEARTVGRALTGDAGEVRDEIHDLWYSTAKESREQIGDGRRGNAWRHHTASQRTAEQYGPLTSFVVGLQHEVGKNLWDYFQGRYKTKDIGLRDILRSNAMDMYNNATGIYDAMTGAQTPTSQMSQLNNDEYNKG
jgi:hypothetical protein